MSTSKPRSRRWLRWLSHAAFALACAAVAGIVLVLTVLPRLTGGAALTVLTGSMTPDIPVGSVVLIRPVDPQSLRVGDVATYQVSPESRALVTHRIIDVRGAGDRTRFEFKGDANRGADDGLVPPQAIRGEVWFHVPFLGTLRDAVQGANLVILLAPPVLGLYAAWLVVGGVRDRRRRSEPAPPVDRSLLAARFTQESVDTLTGDPDELARRWGGVLIADDHQRFTVLLSSTPSTADEMTTLVRGLGPDAMWSASHLDPDAWDQVPTDTTAGTADATVPPVVEPATRGVRDVPA